MDLFLLLDLSEHDQVLVYLYQMLLLGQSGQKSHHRPVSVNIYIHTHIYMMMIMIRIGRAVSLPSPYHQRVHVWIYGYMGIWICGALEVWVKYR